MCGWLPEEIKEIKRYESNFGWFLVIYYFICKRDRNQAFSDKVLDVTKIVSSPISTL